MSEKNQEAYFKPQVVQMSYLWQESLNLRQYGT